jgi:hypothetical protein
VTRAPMRNPTHYVTLQGFSIAASRAPRVYKYEWDSVAIHWSYFDVLAGDLLKLSPAGILTVFRRGDLIAQRAVTQLAIRSMARTRWIRPV